MAFLSGKDGRADFASNELEITSWTFDMVEEDLDTTHSNSSGYKESVGGIRSGSGTVEANWDGTAEPTDNPPNITVGTTGTLQLYTDGTANFSVPSRISDLSVSSEVAGLVTYSFNYVCIGAWTNP